LKKFTHAVLRNSDTLINIILKEKIFIYSDHTEPNSRHERRKTILSYPYELPVLDNTQQVGLMLAEL
jgi:hypothetical protein